MRSRRHRLESPNAQLTLAPVVPVRGMIPPGMDQMLSNAARAAQPDDAELRNTLYAAYAPRLHRILVRYWYRNLREFGCELADLEQETFLIFARLLDGWSGAGSFSAYLHGAFPWRIYDAARRFAPREQPITEQVEATLGEDESFAAEEALALLEELASSLSPFDRMLLLRHVREGETLAVIARSTGLSHRTVRRAWLRLQQHLRALLANR